MRRHGEHLKSRPRAIVDSLREECREELCVHSNEPWCYLDKMHVMHLLDRKEVMRAHALACQSAKAFHLVALSDGQRHIAWPLTGLPDLLRRKKFAWTAAELETVADWDEAEEAVERKSKGGPPPNVPVSEDNAADDAEESASTPAAPKQAAAKANRKAVAEKGA